MKDYEALELLKKIIRIESVHGNEDQVANILEETLENEGIKTERVVYAPGRTNLIAKIQGGYTGGPTLAYSGHMDVVPAGNIAWFTDPFTPTEKNGRLYGRGTADMKAGLVAQVAAMIRLKEKNKITSGTLKFLATVGEETSGLGAQQLANLGYANDVDAMVIGEPTNLGIASSHKGVFWIRIQVEGQSAHGSNPEKGKNAIKHLVEILHRIKEYTSHAFEGYVDPLSGPPTISINSIQGGNSINLVPDQAHADIDIRLIGSQDDNQIKRDIETILAETDQEGEGQKSRVEYLTELPALSTSIDDSFTQLMLEAASEIKGKKIVPSSFSGGTDASLFIEANPKIPYLICGPGSLSEAHQPNESVSIEEFYQAIDLYEKVAERYLS